MASGCLTPLQLAELEVCLGYMKKVLDNAADVIPGDLTQILADLMRRFVSVVAKRAPWTWLTAVFLLTPIHAVGMDQEFAQSPPQAESEEAGQTPQTKQQEDPRGKSQSSANQNSQRKSVYRAWRQLSDQEEASEPNWLTPLATTSGRIKNEFRYDIWRQTTPTGSTILTFGGGKGLECIVAPRVQLLLGVPSYLDRSAPSPPDGFGDLPLMVKFRLASASVSEGNYLVTFLLSATAPTASRPNGAGEAVLTPTLALGKGWGQFDVQTTFGANLPARDTQRLGSQLVWNTAFQYHAGWKLWPELEVNSTFFEQGTSAGQTQTFLTPGLGFGRVRLIDRLRFSIAGGIQIAVTRFHTYDHRWMLSVRFPF